MSENRRTAALRWTGQGLQFDGTTGSAGPERVVRIDGDSASGPAPMELLLLSLGGCMAIDIRVILEKSRVELTSLELDIEGERRGSDPKSYESVKMHFRLAGPGEQDRAKVTRAVRLSEEKYCSVYHSLRPDLEIRSSFELA
ncbi:MAG: OsmC family peroxiredoxin [Gemmatimonadales bacterium]|nr:MAG: OsmC family peroxiredoxin [Gemmatimonadales bacterium]